MAPKRKDLLKPKGKAKTNNPPVLQSEDDFLDAADVHEQAAGKWRAGDAAKATRFFKRAIDVYDEGLRRFPTSFDLAYNKANLEYNFTQDPRIVPHLGPKITLLEETLQSHRTAMQVAPSTNTDILYNTAQVLTSLADAVQEAETPQVAEVRARALLEEATDLFTKCLGSQQDEYERLRTEIEQAMKTQEQSESAIQAESSDLQQADHDDDSNMEIDSSTSPGQQEWATVEEPLTPEAILETCTAQLEALAALLSLYDTADTLAIESKVQQGLSTSNTSIPTLISLIQDSPFNKKPDQKSTAGPTLSLTTTPASEDLETSPKDAALLAKARFQAAVAELQYRAGQLTPEQYATTIESLFTTLINQSESEPQPAHTNAQCAYADALIDLASTVSEKSPSHSKLTWDALCQAQKLLASLTTPNRAILPASRLANIFLARGDVDLFRYRLCLMKKPSSSSSSTQEEPAEKNTPLLATNTGIFYRNARAYAEKAVLAGTLEEKVLEMADGKAMVAEWIKAFGDGVDLNTLVSEEWVRKRHRRRMAWEELVKEGVFGLEDELPAHLEFPVR